MLHYALQPRRHQHEGRVAVREGPDDPRPPPDLAVDAPDPVVRPDPASVLRREFRVGKRLDEPACTVLSLRSVPTSSDVASSSCASSDPSSTDAMSADTARAPFVNDLLFSRWKSYDGSRAVFRYAVVNLRKKLCVTTV